MKKIRIGILGPSDIAFRRFLPAIKSSIYFHYEGVAISSATERFEYSNANKYSDMLKSSQAKAVNFVKEFGGDIYNSYEELLKSDNIDAIYIPLPPALHYYWAKKALECGKHVLLEKPFTTNINDTNRLIKIASLNNLAVHENYAFCYHKQIDIIRKKIYEGEIGELRQIRTAFGFPYRGSTDFRYNKNLGGGALLDCGGYPIKLASLFLGETTKIMTASLKSAKEHDVDVFGSATLENDEQITAQVSFGMDNSYKCELEIWGSEGCIFAPRVFTPPANLQVTVYVRKNDEIAIQVPIDDQFLGSINYFYHCILDSATRIKSYKEIGMQSRIIEEIFKINKQRR